MKTFWLALPVLFACAASSCSGRVSEAVIVAGSTSVQPYAEMLAEEYGAMNPEIEIDVQGGGSSAGITAAVSGAAHIGMSSRELYENETEEGLEAIEFAKDGLAIIVHPLNPVESLSLRQVRDVYAGRSNGWNELSEGGSGTKIHVITREEGSGTRSAFESLVMGDETISPRSIVQDSNGAVRQLVSDDVNSIGFISLGLVDETVKAVRLDGVVASYANIENGTYSLYRPFLFVTAGGPSGHAGEFIDFALSAEGQRILAREGLIAKTGRD